MSLKNNQSRQQTFASLRVPTTRKPLQSPTRSQTSGRLSSSYFEREAEPQDMHQQHCSHPKWVMRNMVTPLSPTTHTQIYGAGFQPT